MSTSKISKEMKNEEMFFHDMDFEFYENPNTIVDQDFHGEEEVLPLYYVLHDTKSMRGVAFEGIDTGRRFYSCAVKRGVNCGVVKWFDQPWPLVMQRCLLKLSQMLHKGNGECQEQKEETSKLKKDVEQLNLKLMNLERQKKQLNIDHKELKSIHTCLTGAFRNIEEERDETKLDRDFLEHEVNILKGNKNNMETVVSDLIAKGSADRYELLRIKEILEE